MSALARELDLGDRLIRWAQNELEADAERAAIESVESAEDERLARANGQAPALQPPLNGSTTAVPEAGRRLFRPIAEIIAERREVLWLPGLHKVLEQQVLAVIAGRRGTFKSFIAHDWMLRTALAGSGVAILSGEGAGLGNRTDAWLRVHAPDQPPGSLKVVALEMPVNLLSSEVMEAVCEDLARQPWPINAVMIDTLSKFTPGLEENSNAEVAAFLASLVMRIRDRFKCTVLLIVHAGHGEQVRPRGASALMANPDAEYIAERPDALAKTVTVTRERYKDSPALPPLAYEATVIDLGRLDQHGEAVTSLALRSVSAPAPVPKAARGKNQAAAIIALREWSREHPDQQHITSIDVAAILKAQGIGSKRKPEVLDSLVNARVITPAIGGFTFDGAAP